MFIFDINNRGKLSIYEYIYTQIREDILSGRLAGGVKLPSKRELAAGNGIAVITVENAYEQLLTEGYIESVPRRGYYVADIELRPEIEFKPDTDVSVLPNKKMHTTREKKKIPPDKMLYTEASSFSPAQKEYALGEGNKKPKSEEYKQKISADFTSGIFQSDSFPYMTWAKLMRRVISDREQAFTQAPPSKGLYELRQAISKQLREQKGLNTEAENIIVGPGTEYLHSIILQLIGRNRLVAVEDPGYKKAEQIYESNGMKVIHIPVNDEGIDVDRLYDSNVLLVHVSPAHHFPTGTIMPAARRHRLIAWARRQGAYVIEDDYDSEFKFRGRPMPTLMSLDGRRVIYMNTFTGSLAPSIRIAYMVLPEELTRIYDEKLRYLSGTVSTFEQLALAAFISEGYYGRHINRMRNRYRKLKQLYQKVFEASKLRRIASLADSDVGLHFVLKLQDFGVPAINNIDEAISEKKNKKQKVQTTANIMAEDKSADISDEKIMERLKQKGIFVRAVSDYSYSTTGKYRHCFVLRYMDISEEKLEWVFDTIYSVCGF